MLEYLGDSNFLVVLFLIVLALAVSGLVMVYLFWRKGMQSESVIAATEWQPTGKIDFYCAEMPGENETPASFLLRVEEYRIVESISGVEHTEIRWRKAVLSEAKSVLTVHQNATDTGNKAHPISGLVRVPASAAATQPLSPQDVSAGFKHRSSHAS